MMYRLVFTSRAPATRRLRVEYGPWQPDKAMIDKWRAFFAERGLAADLSVEEQGHDAAPTLNSRFVQS